MNLNIMYQHLSKLEIIHVVYKKIKCRMQHNSREFPNANSRRPCHEPILMGLRGLTTSGVQGAEPLVKRSRGQAPFKLKVFKPSDVQGGQTLQCVPFHNIIDWVLQH